jgi:hypothetical protein
MLRRTPARARGRQDEDLHPDEEALLALVEGRAPAEATREHVAHCPLCSGRLAELQAIRQVLRATAAREAAPSRDLARDAIARVQVHRATVGGLNEVLAILSVVLRGFALLFAPRRTRHVRYRPQGMTSSTAQMAVRDADTPDGTGAGHGSRGDANG